MIAMVSFRSAAITGLIILAGDASAQPAKTVPPSYALAGQTASGEVISEDGNQLRLNVTPCGSTPTIVVFHQPYASSSRGSTQCNGASKALVQVLQK
jgi:hypothetical protein